MLEVTGVRAGVDQLHIDKGMDRLARARAGLAFQR